MNQSELEASTCYWRPAREKTCEREQVATDLVWVLLLIGRESGARFFNQSHSEVKQNQSKTRITFDTQLKTALTNQDPIDRTTRAIEWRQIGQHGGRRSLIHWTKQDLQWNPQGRRKKGKAKEHVLQRSNIRPSTYRKELDGGWEHRPGQTKIKGNCEPHTSHLGQCRLR